MLKTEKELARFYNTALLPELEPLEEERKKTRSRVIVFFIVVIPVVVAIIGVIFLLGLNQVIYFVGICAPFVVVALYKLLTREYRSNFKAKVIAKIVSFIDPNLTYSYEGRVTQDTFEASKIFTHSIDDYDGEDYVTGSIGETTLEFSELHAQYETRDKRGRKQKHTIFKGIFFVADFNKHFQGETIVLPDIAERLLGSWLGKMLQSVPHGRGELVNLENPDFEKHFAVYSNDQVEVRYILTPNLMQRILEYKNKTREKIHLSFVENRVFVAISNARDEFEPHIFASIVNFDLIKGYYGRLQLVTDIVDDLKLNTRIWSKS